MAISPELTDLTLYGITKVGDASQSTSFGFHTEVNPNPFPGFPDSLWTNTSYPDYSFGVGYNLPRFSDHSTNHPYFGFNWESIYFTQGGIPQTEFYFFASNPKHPFSVRWFSSTHNLDTNDIYAAFDVTALEVRNTSGKRNWLLQTSANDGPTIQHYFDDNNLAITRVGEGGKLFTSASGTDASITLALNGGGHTLLDTNTLSVVHGGTGSRVFEVNRHAPSVQLNNRDGGIRLHANIVNDNAVVHLHDSNYVERIRLDSAGPSFFLGGSVDFGTNAIVNGVNLSQLIQDLQARIAVLEQAQ